MNFELDKPKTKILKIIIGIFTALWTFIFIPCLWIIFFTKAYEHPGSIFPIIFGLAIYINAFRFFKIAKENNDIIDTTQFKIWLMLLARGIFVSCLYASIVGKSVLYSIVFFSMYAGSCYCEYLLKNNKI